MTDKHSVISEAFNLHYDVNTEHNNPIFSLLIRLSGLWWCTIKPCLVAKGSAVQYTHTHTHIHTECWISYFTPHCKVSVYHNIMFGYKRWNGSADVFLTNINWNFEPLLWHWPWTQQCFHKILHLMNMMMYGQIRFHCKRINSSEDNNISTNNF